MAGKKNKKKVESSPVKPDEVNKETAASSSSQPRKEEEKPIEKKVDDVQESLEALSVVEKNTKPADVKRESANVAVAFKLHVSGTESKTKEEERDSTKLNAFEEVLMKATAETSTAAALRNTDPEDHEDMIAMDKKIDELIQIFNDPDIDMMKKILAIITIPHTLNLKNLTPKKCDKLFANMPIEILQSVLTRNEKDFVDAKPIIAHVLSFCVQSSSPEVYAKFKPLLRYVVDASGQKNQSLAILNDITVIITYMPCHTFQSGDLKLIFDQLRHLTGFFINEKEKIDVFACYTLLRLMLVKIFQLITLNPEVTASMEAFDLNVWPVRLISLLRTTLSHSPEKFSDEVRDAIWDVVGTTSRLIGPKWFTFDEKFAKIVCVLNSTEMQMLMQNPTTMNPVCFTRHLRIFEVFILSIQDCDLFSKNTNTVDTFFTIIGDFIKFVFNFWCDAKRENVELHKHVDLNLFTFTIFLIGHDEFEIVEESCRKQLGPILINQLDQIFFTPDFPDELIFEISHLVSTLFERINDILILTPRLPVVAVEFMKRVVSFPDKWKQAVADVSSGMELLRCRVDWCNKESIEEALTIMNSFRTPQVDKDLKPIRKILESRLKL